MKQHIRLKVKAVNNKIIAEQERLGFTGREMAKYLGVHPSTYSSLVYYQFFKKNGEKIIGNRTLMRVCELLGYTMEELFSEHAELFANAINFGKTEVVVDDNRLKLLTEQKNLTLLSESISYFDDRDVKLEINRVLNIFEPKKADMIKMFYGLDGYKEHNFDEIGNKHLYTGARVGQIIHGTIKKLKHESNSKLLRKYL